VTVAPGGPLLTALKRWRLERSKQDGVPAYVVFHDSTLAEIADRRPKSPLELRSVSGVGPTKLERYGDEILAVIAVGES
jgi:ATP-dependent DNA helicase RecQ